MAQEVAERLKSALSAKSFRQGLRKIIKYVRGELPDCPFPLKPMWRHGKDIAWRAEMTRGLSHLLNGSPESIASSPAAQDALARLVDSEIIANTGYPPILTYEDFIESANAHLMVDEGGWDEAYNAFVRSVIDKILATSASDRLVVTRYFGDPILTEMEENPVLWSNESFRILLFDCSDSEELLCARVEGEASPRAVARLSQDAKHILPSLARSDAEVVGDPGPVDPVYTLDLTRQALAVQFSPQDKGDTLARCLRNAIWFLAEADNQSNESVAFALCFAAIEAMVGQRGGELTKRLAENTAVLLEGDPRERIKAIDHVKYLYDMRCDVVHGDDPHEAGEFVEQVRFIAALLMSAVFEWRSFVRSLTLKPSREELLRELYGAFATAQSLHGIPEFDYMGNDLPWRSGPGSTH